MTECFCEFDHARTCFDDELLCPENLSCQYDAELDALPGLDLWRWFLSAVAGLALLLVSACAIGVLVGQRL